MIPNEDGTLTVQSMGADATPIGPNATEQVLADFWGQGSPADVRIESTTVLTPKMKTPTLSIPSSGKMLWYHTSSIYELQQRNSLIDGEWLTIRKMHGTTETEIPDSGDASYFRIKAVP